MATIIKVYIIPALGVMLLLGMLYCMFLNFNPAM